MKKLLLTPLVLICLNQLNAQIVDIPDPELKKILVSNTDINTNMNAEIEVSEASAFTGGLGLVTFGIGVSIENLKGLEAFTQIESLTLSNVTDPNIDLTANTALKDLNINNSFGGIRLLTFPVVTINLSNMAELATVDINVPEFGSLLLDNTLSLKSLRLKGSGFDTLDTSKLLLLEELTVTSNPDLTGLNLADNRALRVLAVSNTNLSEIDITNNTSLIELDLVLNAIEAIDVSQNAKLTRINLTNNKIKTLDLTNNPEITFIKVNSNELTSLNMANGANALIGSNDDSFTSRGNPDLQCVQVDSGFIAPTGWGFDSQTSFSSDCGNASPVLSVNDVETSNSASEISWSKNNISIVNSSAVKSASIYSIAGKNVINLTSKSIDIASLQSGIYILSLTSEEGARENFKFIKE